MADSGFFPGSGPSVYALPPGADFASAFADGFYARFANSAPEDTARATIMVNTQLALRKLEEALADRAPGPGVLPRMVLISDLHGDPLLCPDVPAAVAPIRRRLHLARLVEAFLASTRSADEPIASAASALALADELAFLMDQFHDEGRAIRDLQHAIEGSGLGVEAARHWQRTLAFVDLIGEAWPKIREEEAGARTDPRQRQRAVIDQLISEWRDTPPDHAIIAAGSTGSVSATAELLAAISLLPRGAVVLPGFDPEIEPEIWQSAGPDHAYGPFRGLFRRLDLQPSDAHPWVAMPSSPRRALLDQALRPAPVTDRWHAQGSALRAQVDAAVDGITLIEAPGQRQEAEAIALAIREAIDVPGRRVTLVSPDAALARRVGAALGHFGIVPDDTAGQPLAQTPPAVLTRLVIETARGDADALTLGGLLQHPLLRPGCSRLAHLDMARAYERQVLRKGSFVAGEALLPGWPHAEPPGAAWLDRIRGHLKPLCNAMRVAPLSELLECLIHALEAFTDAGDDKGPAVWDEEPGAALDRFFRNLSSEATAYGSSPVADLAGLLQGLMQGEQVRPRPREPHPRVRFCGPREARLESADLVILSGLNDGVWPEIPDAGPWLSRPMRAALGLPLPERLVGLAAHDFLNAACGPEIILSRSVKAGGAATVASRWLIRLETLMSGIGAGDAWDGMKARGQRLVRSSRRLGKPSATVPRAARPAPKPPSTARPRRLSVTAIETLIRDAYAVYAREVLRLRPLDPLHRAAEPRDRGNALHKVLEAFIKETPSWPGRDAAARVLADTAERVLAAEVPWPDARRAWRARIDRFADWFLDQEDKRRADAEPLASERSGKMQLTLPSGPFEITAKADRIDRLPGGAAAVYDYKSAAPTKKMVNTGFSQQLHIQAAILEAGGFDRIPAATALRGAYIGLGGSESSQKEVVVDDLSAELPERMEKLAELLERFVTDAPFVSHSRPQLTTYTGDYDHLARVGEWSLEDEE